MEDQVRCARLTDAPLTRKMESLLIACAAAVESQAELCSGRFGPCFGKVGVFGGHCGSGLLLVALRPKGRSLVSGHYNCWLQSALGPGVNVVIIVIIYIVKHLYETIEQINEHPLH